jgi:hypothetical protein
VDVRRVALDAEPREAGSNLKSRKKIDNESLTVGKLMDDAFEKVLGAAATYRQPDHSALAAFLERIGDRLVHAGDPLLLSHASLI